MTTDAHTPAAPAGLTLLLAIVCGLTAANLYYVQPLAGPVGIWLPRMLERP